MSKEQRTVERIAELTRSPSALDSSTSTLKFSCLQGQHVRLRDRNRYELQGIVTDIFCSDMTLVDLEGHKTVIAIPVMLRLDGSPHKDTDIEEIDVIKMLPKIEQREDDFA